MAPSKNEKKGLTLEKLAAYDDVITDALVDKVGYDTGSARLYSRCTEVGTNNMRSDLLLDLHSQEPRDALYSFTRTARGGHCGNYPRASRMGQGPG